MKNLFSMRAFGRFFDVLAVCRSLHRYSPALMLGAAGLGMTPALYAQQAAPAAFSVLQFQPVAKVQVAGTPAWQPLYDYTYKLEMRNGSAAQAELALKLSSRIASLKVVDGEVNFGSVAAYANKVGSDTITLRGGKYFDKRLDAKKESNGQWRYVDPGQDPDDAQVPGLRAPGLDWNEESSQAFYNSKLQSLLQGAFAARSAVGAPVLQNPLPLGGGTAARPTISLDFKAGSAELDLTKLQVWVDGKLFAGTIEKLSSGFKLRPEQDLSDGLHTVQVQVQDKAGQQASAQWRFLLDTRAPQVSAQYPRDLQKLGQMSVISANLDEAGGVGLDLSKLVFKLDGVDVSAQCFLTPASVVYMPSSPITPGPHKVQLHVQDSLGNAQDVEWQFGVAQGGPEITQLLPQDTSVLAANALPLLRANFKSATNVTKFTLLLDGTDISAQAQLAAGVVSHQVASTLSEGLHTVQLRLEDAQGQSSEAFWRFTTRTAPEITLVAPKDLFPAGQMFRLNAKYRDQGAGIAANKTILLIDGVNYSAQAQISDSELIFMPPGMFPPGSHLATLTVFDKAGNSTTTSWRFTIDIGLPQISGQTPKDVQVTDPRPQIAAQYQDSSSGIDTARVKLWLDNQDVTAQAQIGAGGFSFTPAAALAAGSHSVKLQVFDKAGNKAESSWNFSVAISPNLPEITVLSPAQGNLPQNEALEIRANYAARGSEIDVRKVILSLDGQDVSAQANISTSAIFYSHAHVLAEGAHQIQLSVTDKAGMTASKSWSFNIVANPQIISVTPKDVQLSERKPLLTAQFLPGSSPVNSAKVWLDGQDLSSLVRINGNALSLQTANELAYGTHQVLLQLINQAGLVTEEAWSFDVVQVKNYQVTILSPTANSRAEQNKVLVKANASANLSEVSRLEVNGVRMNKVGDAYQAEISLQDGNNTITVRAWFEDGGSQSASAQVVYDAPPVLSILSPLDKSTLGPINPNSPRDLSGNVERPVQIKGRSSKPVTAVSINQQGAQLSNGGTEFTFNNFFLHEGINLLNAVAQDAQGRIATANVTVSVDQTAPIISIEAPLHDAVISSATLDVRGVVNDAVEGWGDTPYPTVQVSNSANGKSVTAKVQDRFYVAQDLALEIGNNRLQVVATDHVGNNRSREVNVTRIAAGSKRLTLLAGNRQQGGLNAELPKPLAVVALAADGNPLSNLAVNFDIQRGTGGLRAQQGSGSLQRNLQVMTDAAGRAQVWLTLGKQSGEAGNVVRASSAGISEDVVFSASAEKGLAAFVRADAGVNQYGETNAPALEALSAVVTDAEENRLSNAAVEFVIREGDAFFLDESGARVKTLQVASDRNGLAIARPQFGAQAGVVRISANLPQAQNAQGGTVYGASYQINVLQQQNAPTRFSGKVLSHNGVPLAGVRVSLGRTSLSTTTDDTGFFSFDGQVPAGKLDLFVDGRTANVKTAEYPALHFEALAVRGQNNALPHPIYLPPLLVENGQIVGGDKDVTLRIPGFEGFEMIVKANSVTFPDGARTGRLVVSPVQQDKLPMVPPGGYAGFMAPAWTIQPSGARFDPPIQVKIPNSIGLKAGETREIYQWDHDLATFVPMGRATVNEDASLLITDAGSGVTKAGWGGPPNPPPDPPKCAKSDPPPADDIACYELKAGADGCRTWQPRDLSKFKIKKPADLPNPGNDEADYKPFYYDPRTGNAETTTINAEVEVPDAALGPKVEWKITKKGTVTEDAEEVTPADKKGLTLSFKVKGKQHPAYAPNTGGSRERSPGISYELEAKVCVGKPNATTKTATMIQDQRDIIRQEYLNHAQFAGGPRVPGRAEIEQVVATTDFAPAAMPNAYDFAWGQPLTLAQSVLDAYRTRMVARFGGQASQYNLTLNSGWRNPERNERVGGVLASKHQYGGATDLKPANLPNGATRAQAFCELLAAGESAAPFCIPEHNTTQLSSCNDATITHVHCDNRS